MNLDLKKVMNKKIKRANKKMKKSMLADTTKYVPKDTGYLRSTGHVDKDGIVWDADYARKVYYMPIDHRIGFRLWFDVSQSVNMKKWEQIFQDELNK